MSESFCSTYLYTFFLVSALRDILIYVGRGFFFCGGGGAHGAAGGGACVCIICFLLTLKVYFRSFVLGISSVLLPHLLLPSEAFFLRVLVRDILCYAATFLEVLFWCAFHFSCV